MVSAMSVGISPGRRGAGRGGASWAVIVRRLSSVIGYRRPPARWPAAAGGPCRWSGRRTRWRAGRLGRRVLSTVRRCAANLVLRERRAPAVARRGVGFSEAPDEYPAPRPPSPFGPAVTPRPVRSGSLRVQHRVQPAPGAGPRDRLDPAGQRVAPVQQAGRAGQLAGLDHPICAVGLEGEFGARRQVQAGLDDAVVTQRDADARSWRRAGSRRRWSPVPCRRRTACP